MPCTESLVTGVIGFSDTTRYTEGLPSVETAERHELLTYLRRSLPE